MQRIVMDRSGETEAFLRVVQEGGFSAAARTLGLTQSAVSKLVTRLEVRLGARLLTRTTRALNLTEEGETYLQAGQQIIQQLNAAEQAVAAGAVKGRLRVNASIPFGAMFGTSVVAEFLAKHPDIIIDFSVTDDVVDLLAQKADVAIRMGNLPDTALLARRLGQSRRIVCASRAYLKRKGTPDKPDDLRGHDCLTFNFRRSRVGWPFRVKGKDIEQPVAGPLQVNNGETMKQMMLAGVGVGRVGLWHVAAEIKSGALQPLLEKYNPGDMEVMHAIHVGGGQVPNRVRAFIDHLVRTFGASPFAK
jgi:DNA-binding transcriptional LysR family regulator